MVITHLCLNPCQHLHRWRVPLKSIGSRLRIKWSTCLSVWRMGDAGGLHPVLKVMVTVAMHLLKVVTIFQVIQQVSHYAVGTALSLRSAVDAQRSFFFCSFHKSRPFSAPKQHEHVNFKSPCTSLAWQRDLKLVGLILAFVWPLERYPRSFNSGVSLRHSRSHLKQILAQIEKPNFSSLLLVVIYFSCMALTGWPLTPCSLPVSSLIYTL